MTRYDYLKSINAPYIEELFESYLKDPESIDDTWRFFFDGIDIGSLQTGDQRENSATAVSPETVLKELKVAELIRTYRTEGHRLANINPLKEAPKGATGITHTSFGLANSDLDSTFQAGTFLSGTPLKLAVIIEKLTAIYTGSIGIEYMFMSRVEERDFIQKKFESRPTLNFGFSKEDQKYILKRLVDSESLERFIHARFPGAKRFSVEGAESMLPGLDLLIEKGVELGATEAVIGMAHRGRLNFLVNLLGKKPLMLFSEFDDNYVQNTDHGEGDVKYHKGFESTLKLRNGKSFDLSLAYNPSHLEFVNVVVEGMVRGKQERKGDSDRSKIFPILIHGDTGFGGQGIVYETVTSSQIPGYATGGTLHYVINNQVGFTTDWWDGRSTVYCTDLAKMVEAPIFHVNGDDPEAVAWVSQLAMEYRTQFKRDIFIDVICYRKYGHNEGDEPSFTQPTLYAAISAHNSPREVYAAKLVAASVLDQAGVDAFSEAKNAEYQVALTQVRAEKPEPTYSAFEGIWSPYGNADHESLLQSVFTGVPEKNLKELGEKLNTFPTGFKVHPKLSRSVFEARKAAVEAGKGLDWGNAEALAFASLIEEGTRVRLSGQDAERGTFGHRNSVVHNVDTGEEFTPLNALKPGKNAYQVFNSYLSETGVMGFDYGYSLSSPESLVIWEAQFGDFVNGAQVIVDQFIATSESKWHRNSGLMLLLPHGYEGAGPEHSSAKLERFLQLCGRENIFVTYVSTPANLFHLIRRQVHQKFRKPTVLMTPKSLLRLPQCVSDLSELVDGSFEEVLDDPAFPSAEASSVERVLLCTGKIYYELLAAREEKNLTAKVALVRLEQLYPWPEAKLRKILEKYSKAKDFIWVQEEPRNMGAWMHVYGIWSGGLSEFGATIGGGKHSIRYVGRDIASSPAVGSAKLHKKEQASLIDQALGKL